MSRRCAMGCKTEPGVHLHVFPQDPKRRAEWCRILGLFPRTKRLYLCKAHIPDYYVFGNRLSKYAFPNPPPSRIFHTMSTDKSMFHNVSNYPKILTKYDKPVESSYESEIKTESLNENPLHIGDDNVFSSEHTDASASGTQQTFEKVEDFEIRKGSTNDMIIKGRYVQTNDYLVVSYTPPRKWSLQEQVKILDKTCQQQLRSIRALTKENNRLSIELRKHEKLLPKLRFLQAHNRYLYAQLKMYKIDEKNRRKRIKKTNKL